MWWCGCFCVFLYVLTGNSYGKRSGRGVEGEGRGEGEGVCVMVCFLRCFLVGLGGWGMVMGKENGDFDGNKSVLLDKT